jgi:LemA protein
LNMKKIVFGILCLFTAMSLSSCSYNSMVKKDENVKAAWGAVQSQYQRRSDLIPNLVSTVKGAANFEKSTLTAVIEARAKATSIQVDPSKLTPESIQQFQAAQGQLGSALGKLLAVSEAYPDLKANANFQSLQTQLEGTENRINVSRLDFNTAVQDFNSTVRSFPANLTAKMFGFTEKGYFAAEAGADKAPKVSF